MPSLERRPEVAPPDPSRSASPALTPPAETPGLDRTALPAPAADATPTLDAAATAVDPGVTGGAVTLDDFAHRATGAGADQLDVAGAQAKNAEYDAMTLADWSKQFADAKAAEAAGTPVDGRSEEEMLAAIAANTAPKYLARVGPASDFGRGTFGNPRRDFIFATEPADLVGCSAIEAMVKVGWTREWIDKNAGAAIAVCVLDTSKAIQVDDGAGGTKDEKPAVGDFEWAQLIPKALGDANFVQLFKDQGAAQLTAVLGPNPADAAVSGMLQQLLDAWSVTPVGGKPAVGGGDQSQLAAVVRDLIKTQYGANELYSGMGATITEKGDLGAREVMVEKGGTGFKLTPDNHTLISLDPYTTDDVKKALDPPPTVAAPPVAPTPPVS